MKIIKSGITNNKFAGTCKCGCEIECSENETSIFIDREGTCGMGHRLTKCPECGNDFLWVSPVLS